MNDHSNNKQQTTTDRFWKEIHTEEGGNYSLDVFFLFLCAEEEGLSIIL